MSKPRTIIEKLWDLHVVAEKPGAPSLIYIDLHLVHEVTSPQAFSGLRERGLKVRRPDLTLATCDHSHPDHADPPDRRQDRRDTGRPARGKLQRIRHSVLSATSDRHQGIVHVIGPEQGSRSPA